LATNGRLDLSSLVDWDGHQNYLTPEAARQWIAFRQAYHQQTGYWLYTSECYRPVGDEGDYARGRINTQWYWFEYYGRNTKWAAYPGSTSSHGWALAADLVGWPERPTLIALAAQYGFTFPFSYEDWHIQYIGNPSITASLNSTAFEEDDMYDENARKELLTKLDEITRIVGVLAGWPGAATEFEVAAQLGPKDANEARRMLGVLLGWQAPASDNEIAALAKLYGGATIDTSLVRDTITAAVRNALAGVQGADINAIAAAVDARLANDFAAIPAAVAHEQSDRLKS
jgi:hypothetical protein